MDIDTEKHNIILQPYNGLLWRRRYITFNYKTSSWSVFKYEDHPKRRLEGQSLNIMKIRHALVWNPICVLERDQSTTVCNSFIQADNAAVHTFWPRFYSHAVYLHWFEAFIN